MRLFSNLSSLIVAMILLYTGFIHAAQPYFFVHTIDSYLLLPADVSGILGLFLPYLQIVLALCIGLRIAEKVALWMSAVLFTTFACAQTSVFMRGIEIDCGCFGFVPSSITPSSIAFPTSLALISVLSVLFNRKAGSRKNPEVFEKLASYSVN